MFRLSRRSICKHSDRAEKCRGFERSKKNRTSHASDHAKWRDSGASKPTPPWELYLSSGVWNGLLISFGFAKDVNWELCDEIAAGFRCLTMILVPSLFCLFIHLRNQDQMRTKVMHSCNITIFQADLCFQVFVFE